MGWVAYAGAEATPGLPASFDPPGFALEDRARSRLDTAVIGRELDPAPPPSPELEAPAPTSLPEAPGWRLLLATVDAEHPDRSTSLVADASGARHLLLVGKPQDGVTLAAVTVTEDERGRETVATLSGPGPHTWTLKLRRDP
jgi:hypothetical protein